MKIEKLKVSDDQFDINLQFYYSLKQLVKSKINNNEVSNLLELISLGKSSKVDSIMIELNNFLDSIRGNDKRDILGMLFASIKTRIDLELLVFSLKLYSIRGLLLEESKIKEV